MSTTVVILILKAVIDKCQLPGFQKQACLVIGHSSSEIIDLCYETYSTFILFISSNLNAQIIVEKYDLSIETNLSNDLQEIYGNFLNNSASKVSIVQLKKQYYDSNYYNFLRNKRCYQSRKKWLKNNSIYQESIIVESTIENQKSHAYEIFQGRFKRVDMEFTKNEVFLDSVETKLALKEIFNGEDSDIVNMCYIPRHAIIFYNSDGNAIGIYEICFECSNVKIGIVGTKMFSRKSPYIKSLFNKYEIQLE